MNPFLQTAPDKPAILIDERILTFGDLDRGSRALAVHLRRIGIAQGDTIAILAPNCMDFFIAAWSAQRSGLYFTPIGRHLRPREIAYQLTDSCAKALFVHHSLADSAVAALQEMGAEAAPRVYSMGGAADGLAPIEPVIAEISAKEWVEDIEGSDLLYTSGTTGRPKGVKRPLTLQALGSDTRRVTRLRDLFDMDDGTLFYTPAPIYHAAPLRFAMTVMRMGATLVLEDKFEPAKALKTLSAKRITHSQWVPTMFVRMLDLREAERALYHAPAHRRAIHSGAPCPIPVKRSMIDWWGPILHEYYSSTESAGFTHVTSADWLRFPGTVGRPWGCKAHILSDDFVELGFGKIGNIYFEGTSGLAYHNDEQKTRNAHSPQGWATLGDIGYLSEEGFLFLSDRKNFVIVSGGVNIYPKEIEDVLDSHADVRESAVFGLPDPEFGETVQAVVQLRDPARAGEGLAAELHALTREKLAGYKAPKFIAFVADLPRLPSGKLEKHRLREDYRAGRDRGFSPKQSAHLTSAISGLIHMTHADAVLSLLAIKGFGKAEVLAEALDLSAPETETALAALIASGLAENTRVGARLSAEGKAQAAAALERRRATIDHHRLDADYERFVPLNSSFKQVVTDWQMRQIAGKAVRNDHSDNAYDEAVAARLPPLHRAAAALIADIAARVPEVGAYERRLAKALVRFQAGDHRYLTAPDRDSYHTVWFEFHQDMIGLLGTTRAKEAAAGRAV